MKADFANLNVKEKCTRPAKKSIAGFVRLGVRSVPQSRAFLNSVTAISRAYKATESPENKRDERFCEAVVESQSLFRRRTRLQPMTLATVPMEQARREMDGLQKR